MKMMEPWVNYFWQLFFRFLYLPIRGNQGNYREGKEELAEFVDTVREAETSKKMSDKQIAVSGINAVSVGNSEVESESTEETTLTEIHKDLGHTQISEKKAEFESNETTSLVEENRKKQSEASKSVVQSESVEISKNRQESQPILSFNSQKLNTTETFSLPTISISEYKPLEPVKTFEPIKPFEPIQPFEPLKPFEPPKSFELAKQLESTKQNQSPKLSAEVNGKINSQNGFEHSEPITTQGHSTLNMSLSQCNSNNGNAYEQTKTANIETNNNQILPVGYRSVQPFPPVKSELQSLLQSSNFASESRTSSVDVGGGLPIGYIPVEPLSPLKSSDFQSPMDTAVLQQNVFNSISDRSSKAEIKEENIKNTLKEIISDLDLYAEKDKELKDAVRDENTKVTFPNIFESTVQEQNSSQSSNENWIARLPSCLSEKENQRPYSLPPMHLVASTSARLSKK